MTVKELYSIGWGRQAERARMRGVKLHERAYRVAENLVGVMESGGNNRGVVVEEIIRSNAGIPPEPWCGDFVAYCYRTAGSHRVTRSWAAVRLLLAGRTVRRLGHVKRGDIVRYTFDHTGVFVKWLNDDHTSFEAIEGNTGATGAVSDSKTGGDGVYRKVRTTNQVRDFRRVSH